MAAARGLRATAAMMSASEQEGSDAPMPAPAAAGVPPPGDQRGCVVGPDEFPLAFEALRRSSMTSPVYIFPSCDTDSLCALGILTVRTDPPHGDSLTL